MPQFVYYARREVKSFHQQSRYNNFVLSPTKLHNFIHPLKSTTIRLIVFFLTLTTHTCLFPFDFQYFSNPHILFYHKALIRHSCACKHSSLKTKRQSERNTASDWHGNAHDRFGSIKCNRSLICRFYCTLAKKFADFCID